MIKAHLINKEIFSNEEEARALLNKGSFGKEAGERIEYSVYEALYLLEKRKMKILEKEKEITQKDLMKKISKEKRFSEKYVVFKDLRDKGHVPKTGLKFGADFRVYKSGTSPENAHAEWICFVTKESEKINWQDFASKNRVARSTNKKLLIAVVDEEKEVTYYEVAWMKL